MNVLSLFDGKSGAYSALKSIDITPTNYFASEVGKYSQAVSKYHFPNIIRLGDVNRTTFFGLGKIDLLVAGFPCQAFSITGKRLNFEDPRGKLFFEVVRLIHELKPKYFLLENVNMKKDIQRKINELIGVKPIIINSSLVSAQSRKRLYWTNIPNVKQPKDKHIMLKDIIISANTDKDKIFYIDEKYQKDNHNSKISLVGIIPNRVNHLSSRIYDSNGKCPTITAMSEGIKITTNYTNFRKLTPVECERLQTYPDDYTKYGIMNEKTIEISNAQRYKMIGNGFTRDVIAHILSFIR